MQYTCPQEGTLMARLKGSANLLEDRRRRALALLDTGLSLNEVGRRIECAPRSVMRWLRARRRGGLDALRVRFSPGRPLKLGASQRRRLVKLLLKGPQAHGYRTQLWTTARIAEVIRREFGVSYHRDHIGRLMHSLNWSPRNLKLAPSSATRRPLSTGSERTGPELKKRSAAGHPPSLRRRIGLSLGSSAGQDLGTPRLHSPHSPSSRTPGQNLGHLRNLGQPPTTALEPLLSALLRHHRPRRSVPVSP